MGGGAEVNLFDDRFVARIIESKFRFTLHCLQKGTGVGLESLGGGGWNWRERRGEGRHYSLMLHCIHIDH